MNSKKKHEKKIEFGDYQTPLDFAHQICDYLSIHLNINPTVIFEPTFGVGNFVLSSVNKFKNIRTIYGIEINKDYYEDCLNTIQNINKLQQIQLGLYHSNFFDFDLDKIKKQIPFNEELLIIGNPPWINNSQLSTLNSLNLPQKSNLKQLKGLDAITGKSNFDLAESIILKCIDTFSEYKNLTIVMLCKSSVVYNIVKLLPQFNLNIKNLYKININSKEIFNIDCDACCLVIQTQEQLNQNYICKEFTFNNIQSITKSFGWVDQEFISNITHSNLDLIGTFPIEWRQGVKHDCSKIMELSLIESDNIYQNGHKDQVELENILIYPLIKSSHIKDFIIQHIKKYVIITQHSLKENTDIIEKISPKLWNYLEKHEVLFNNRKSIIYKNAPKYAIFGIGDYSFSRYKIVISGFYKTPIFALVIHDKPVMVDDTCYFIGFEDYNSALITLVLLNSPLVQNFLKSIAFLDTKRPYTKEILMKLNLIKIIQLISYSEFKNIANFLNINISVISKDIYMSYCNSFIEKKNCEQLELI